MSKVYVGDVGTEIVLDCGSSISAATSLEMRVRKPGGQVVTWQATLSGTQAMTYTTVAGDLDLPGVYKLQAKVVLPDWSGLGLAVSLPVYREFD
jgi:hypothetical protein